jgi:hypothetical protein
MKNLAELGRIGLVKAVELMLHHRLDGRAIERHACLPLFGVQPSACAAPFNDDKSGIENSGGRYSEGNPCTGRQNKCGAYACCAGPALRF